MKKLSPSVLKSRREFLRKAAKRTVVPVLVVHSIRQAKADPLFGESRQDEVL